MFLAIVTAYVFMLTLLKLVYLLFKPKFLNPSRFGPPSKLMMSVYYITILFFLLLFILSRLDIITIQITTNEWQTGDLFKFEKQPVLIVMGVALIATVIHTMIEYYLKRSNAS
ncbi:hypothetical protein [Flavihumibacter sp. ZG627]|uniref:hypothetical protein n=1 Tax=Flavihumibacter sp. ZG627 TaxID=1463156 RepID=UPI0005801B9A|nr:hypothetical protein [Flavihumibacter sp. ZG627]KIC90648.1 hypothetical protein HY58_11955 [Flavihumibacter sp. ZG627]